MRRRRAKIRWCLVGVSALFVLLTFAPVLRHLLPTKVQAVTLTEEVQSAIQSRIELSKTLFQSGLLLLAAIWGLVLAKPNEARIVLHDAPEVVMLGLATLVLASAYYAHVAFVLNTTSIVMSAPQSGGKIPDLDHPDVSSALISQGFSVLGGAVIAALTIVSARWLKGESNAGAQ